MSQNPVIDKERDVRAVVNEVMRQLLAPGFFGTAAIEIGSQSGKINNVIARVTKTIKI